jgi:hypothetical protein
MKRRTLNHCAAAAGFSLGLALKPGFVQAQTPPAPAAKPQIKPQPGNNPSRVLWVGNSYLYYNDSLHNIVRAMVAADDASAPQRLQYKSATIGGAQLSHHNIDWLTEPGRIGVKEPFEWVVLQGNSGDALNAAGQAEFRQSAAAARRIIEARGAKVAIYMVHAYVSPHRQARADNIRKIEAFYTEVGNELGALVIPVGLAFERAYAAAPQTALHQSYDGSHPNPLGSYLAAATAYATLYGKNVVGNSFDFYGKASDAQRASLQAVAMATVKDYFSLA